MNIAVLRQHSIVPAEQEDRVEKVFLIPLCRKAQSISLCLNDERLLQQQPVVVLRAVSVSKGHHAT